MGGNPQLLLAPNFGAYATATIHSSGAPESIDSLERYTWGAVNLRLNDIPASEEVDNTRCTFASMDSYSGYKCRCCRHSG